MGQTLSEPVVEKVCDRLLDANLQHAALLGNVQKRPRGRSSITGKLLRFYKTKANWALHIDI